jgi:hypothetical protein
MASFLNIGDNSPIFRTSGISPSKNILLKICVRTVIIFSPACNICSILMYHAGIQDKTWTIIKSLHHNAESCIKWAGSTSDCFKVGMGVRQGGILVNILYASSTGRAAFIGDDPFVNPLCVGFCTLRINGCILSLITASTILIITGRTVI